MKKRTINLHSSQYKISPGKFRPPSVLRHLGIGIGVGTMLGGYIGYKIGRGKKRVKKCDTIVITDIRKSGFFCPYCSATLMMKNPMDDAIHCKCGKNFNIIYKYMFHPKDKNLGKNFDPFDEFEKIGLPIENIKMANKIRSKFRRLWEWHHKSDEKKEEVTKGIPVGPIAAIADDVVLAGYYGYKARKNRKKQRLVQNQRAGS